MQKYLLFIGIDMSKNWFDASISLDGNKDKMSHQRFSNNKAGFEELLVLINTIAVQQDIKGSWLFCMEHTGIYTLPLCEFLERHQLVYVLEGGLHIAASIGVRRGKSDKTDSKDIARYAFLYRMELKPSRLPCGTLLKIKHLLSLRKRVLGYKNGMKVAANELKAFASKATSNEVKIYTEQITAYTDQRLKSIDKLIEQTIQKENDLKHLHQLLTSIKGVGLIISASLLVYTKGFTAFPNARKFACYIGVAPFERTSGSSIHRPAKVSHIANKNLKGLISCGASSATAHDLELRAYYHRRLSEGKNKFKVQNAIRNKFLHRIFAVVKRGTPYVELYQHTAA